jgi:hypothetical protein
LAAAAVRPLQLARAAGPYLITHLSGGSAPQLAATVLVNLAMAAGASSDRQQAVRVLVNQDVIPTLVRLTAGEEGGGDVNDSVRELAYQALYHVVIQADLEADVLNTLVQISLGRCLQQ